MTGMKMAYYEILEYYEMAYYETILCTVNE